MAGATRERILTEATRLFAAQGIKATTVAQIEEAAGLRKGSGGVHRYFATKDDLVEGVLHAQLARSSEVRAEAGAWERPTRDQVPAFLERLGRLVLHHADENRDVALIMLREAHNLPPGVLDEHEAKNLELAYATTAAAIRASQDSAGVDDLDPDALAFLLVAPLIYHRLIEWATGRKILDLDDDRLVVAWVDVFSPVLARLAEDPPR
ncbi:MAG: TetR/AcrR family transcriptional regulator [Acidimicrobiia bacterium]